jgi:hypothetical protein
MYREDEIRTEVTMNTSHRALVDLINQMKPDNLSTLEAALNVITNHAKTIRQQIDEIDRLRYILDQIGILCRSGSIEGVEP